MKIAFNPSTVAALITPPNNKDITFDLRGRNIFARGVKFCGTDTWRDIKINNVSIGSNILDLRNGSNTTLTNTNGVVTINSTWRPVVDNLTSDSTTSSLSANQGRVLKSLIDGKSNSGHTHDDRYLKLTGGTMTGNIILSPNTKIIKPLASTSNYDSIVRWSVDGETKKYGREIGLHNTGGDSTGSIAIIPYKTDTEPWSGNVGLFIAKNTLKLDGKPIALKNDIPTSLKNPYSLTLQANGTTLATYDGSVSKIVNLTYDNVGAAAKNHTHNSLEPWASYITGDSHATALKSIFDKNKTSIPRNKFISMFSSTYGNGSYYMGYFLNGYENAPYGGFFVAHYDTAYYIGISNGSFAQHRLVYSTDIPNSLKNPHALTISLNGTSQGPYDGSAAKSINITPSSIGAATSEHNHDNRYLKLTGGTMQLGEGLKFHADDNYFGTNSDARIISLLDSNGAICDGGLIIDERGTLDGKEYITELLRIRDSEFKWKGSNILHNGNSHINGNTITINGSSLTVSKSDHTHSNYVTALGTNGNYLTWTKNGSTNNITVPYATTSSYLTNGFSAPFVNKWDCNAPDRVVYSDYGSDGRLITNHPSGWHYGTLLELGHTNHRGINGVLNIQLMWDIAHNTTLPGTLWFRGKDEVNGWAKSWAKVITDQNISSILSNYYTKSETDGKYVTLTTPQTIGGSKTFTTGIQFNTNKNGDANLGSNDGFKLFYNETSGKNFPGNYYNVASFITGYTGFQLACYGGTDQALKYRHRQDNGTWHPWKTLAFTTDIPSSLKNPYSLTTFGVVYDGSAAKVVGTSNFISQLEEGTSVVTDGTMFITSWASNSGFADTNAVNIPYKRKAIHLWNYIKTKTDSLYYTESEVNNLLSNKLNTSDFNWTNLPGKLVGENEFNIANAGFNSDIWFNYVPINDRSKTASIHTYIMGNGAKGMASVTASGFIKNGSNSNYVLLGDGGHKAESSLNVANADTVDGYHVTAINNKPWGTIPAINLNGYMDIGKHLEFHFDNTTGSDYSTILMCTGNYSNIVNLPSKSGTLALTSQILTWKSQIIDMRNYDENYWHPVTVLLPYTGYNKIKVSVQLNIYDKPSWATHNAGFTCNMEIWATAHGWGTTNAETICLNYTYAQCNSNPCGWMQLDYPSLGVLFLRGGSRYKVYTDFDATFTPHDKTYTWIDGSYSQSTGGPYTNCPGLNFNKNKIYANLDGYASSAIKLQTPRTIWGQSFNGTNNVSGSLSNTGTITASAAATYDIGSNALDYRNGYFQWIGAKSNTNLRLAANNSDNQIVLHTNGNVGIGTNAPAYKLDVKGDIRATGQIIREASSYPWVNGRKGALLRETTSAGYHTLWSLKTANGSWDFGEYKSSGWNNIPVLSYITDTDFSSGNNNATYQIKFPLASGTVALTSNIPNPTNYYWANVKISASSSTTTSPTVSNLTATNSIRMGNILLENTDEINSASGIHLNYRNSGNVSLCYGGGNVGIGTASPAHKLHVVGDIYTTTGFKKNGSSDSYVLLGGGGHKLISDFATAGHTHDGRYLRWNGSIADISAMNWGTLTAANGYTILSHAASSDGGAMGVVNKGGQIFMQLDGYYYQREGKYRVLDTSDFTTFSNIGSQTTRITIGGVTKDLKIDADLLDGQHGSRYTGALGGLNYITINVGGDANTYYPVVISNISAIYPMQFVNISRVYNETAPNTWNTSTHKGGLTLTLLWNGSRFWDGNSSGNACYCVYKYESYSTMVGGLGNATGGKVVWLRGGGAVYHIHSMNGTSTSVTVYTSTYTDEANHSFSPKTTPEVISVRWPGMAQGADYATSASNADTATKVIVNQHTTNDTNYPLVWSNQNNSNNVTENQLYKSWSDLYYNPKNKRLTVGGSIYAAHFYESSDKTLKKNIKSILSSTNIPKIREFDWKDTEEHSYGFIAQELEEQGYDCLVSEVNGKKTVNYTATLALTVAKLQNLINIQNKKISNLTKELKALKYGRKKNS